MGFDQSEQPQGPMYIIMRLNEFCLHPAAAKTTNIRIVENLHQKAFLGLKIRHQMAIIYINFFEYKNV